MGIVLVSRYYATLRSTGLGGTLDTQRYVHTNIARDRNFFPWSPCSLFWVFLKSRPTHFLMWFLKEYAPCLTKDTRIKSNDISSIMLSMNATMLFKKGRQMCWIMHSNKCTISTDKTVDCCHFCFFLFIPEWLFLAATSQLSPVPPSLRYHEQPVDCHFLCLKNSPYCHFSAACQSWFTVIWSVLRSQQQHCMEINSQLIVALGKNIPCCASDKPAEWSRFWHPACQFATGVHATLCKQCHGIGINSGLLRNFITLLPQKMQQTSWLIVAFLLNHK